MKCKRRPSIRNYAVSAANGLDLSLSADTVAFVLRPALGAGIRIGLPGAGSGDTFDLAAGETYSEEDLQLTEPLKLRVTAAADEELQVWSWEG